jgi:hypothetical protein
MTFEAYLENIRGKTGKTPEDFHREAKSRGILGPDVTATKIVAWLKRDHDLGHGHAMAIFAVFKDRGWVVARSTKRGRRS